MVCSPPSSPRRGLRRPRAPRLRPGAGPALLLGCLWLVGCRDASSDPFAALVTAETVPAIAVPVDLPSLGGLSTRDEVRDELAPVLAAWLGGWANPDAALGRAARDEAIRQATPALREALGAGGVARTLAPLFEAEADLVRIEGVPTDLVAPITEIRSLLTDTRAALEAGRAERALTVGLQASDRIRELGPRAVARALIGRADRALVRGQVTDAVDARSLARGERLLAGARRALDEGDEDLAIQRAYYAAQLLEGEGSVLGPGGDAT